PEGAAHRLKVLHRNGQATERLIRIQAALELRQIHTDEVTRTLQLRGAWLCISATVSTTSEKDEKRAELTTRQLSRSISDERNPAKPPRSNEGRKSWSAAFIRRINSSGV